MVNLFQSVNFLPLHQPQVCLFPEIGTTSLCMIFLHAGLEVWKSSTMHPGEQNAERRMSHASCMIGLFDDTLVIKYFPNSNVSKVEMPDIFKLGH